MIPYSVTDYISIKLFGEIYNVTQLKPNLRYRRSLDISINSISEEVLVEMLPSNSVDVSSKPVIKWSLLK